MDPLPFDKNLLVINDRFHWSHRHECVDTYEQIVYLTIYLSSWIPKTNELDSPRQGLIVIIMCKLIVTTFMYLTQWNNWSTRDLMDFWDWAHEGTGSFSIRFDQLMTALDHSHSTQYPRSGFPRSGTPLDDDDHHHTWVQYIRTYRRSV